VNIYSTVLERDSSNGQLQTRAHAKWKKNKRGKKNAETYYLHYLQEQFPCLTATAVVRNDKNNIIVQCTSCSEKRC